MTTCFIDIVNMFFKMFLKNVLKTRKRLKNQSPIKLLYKTFLKHHLDILKTFLKCQIVSWEAACVTGEERRRIAEGWFTAVVEHAGRLYAGYHNKASIRVYEYANDWTHCDTIDLQCGYQDITLSISGGVLYACLLYVHKLVAYSLAGELQGTWGRRGLGEVGTLHSPLLSMTDAGGAALIADWGNSRLQVLSARRQWSVVPLQPPVERPMSALLHRGKLYVASYSYKTLYVYET